MKRIKILAAFAALLALLVPLPCWGRLPEAGLKRAQEAEQRLKENKPRDAITILEKLVREYPSEPALSLRLGQVYDQINEPGPALYYYRRYVTAAGDHAREEAKLRLYALELVPRAKTAAAEFAAQRGEESQQFSMPTPEVRLSRGRLNPDGSLSPIDGSDSARAEPTPIPTIPPLERPVRRDASTTSAAAFHAAPAAAQPGPQRSPGPTATRVTAPQFTPPPAAPEEAADQPAVAPTPAPARTPITLMAASTPDTPAMPAAPTPRATVQISFSQPAVPKPATTPHQNAAPQRFFSTEDIGGQMAMLELSHSFPQSVLTFNATPGTGQAPVSIILNTNETRSVQVVPGHYRIQITVINNSYPPQTLVDKKLDLTFAPGVSYKRVLTPDDIQSVN